MSGFAFGGRLSLDLTWTVRYRAVHPTELLTSPAALADWLHRAVLDHEPRCSDELLAAAKDLREAIHRSALAAVGGARPAAPDVDAINAWAARPGPYPQLGADGASITHLADHDDGSAGLAVVARDAVELLAAADGRLRACEGPRCALLFHDASRPGRRRWCATARCGNRTNTRAYRDRHRPER
jgi:predicted RNA-binding Zn ribbon-like protein